MKLTQIKEVISSKPVSLINYKEVHMSKELSSKVKGMIVGFGEGVMGLEEDGGWEDV